MMHYFDGEEFTESVTPCTLGQINHIEQIWGNIGHEIPKHKRYELESWMHGLFNMSYEDAERLLSELYTYMPNEYPIYAGEKERAKWLRKNIK